jgi:hypothetical protein
MSSAEWPSREINVEWVGECSCGHQITAELDVTREDRPGVWVSCNECLRENYLTETGDNRP